MSLVLDRFELRAYGPFTGTVLELAGAPGSLHLITGPNEIGKSTAQRAIGDFLFGIPPRSSDNQIHAYGDMRLAATVIDADGARRELVRRKGTRSTLLTPEGAAVDEGVLESMLGGISREAFASMFSITHESLLVGGQELLAAGGEVGESLFSASLGAGMLHRVREDLDREAGELFRPRATSSLILQARARFEAAETTLRETTLRAATFIENERALKVTEAERGQLSEVLSAARAQQNGRRRLRTLIPLLAERDRIRGALDELAAVPVLAPDATERRIRALEAIARDQAALDESEARLQVLSERIAALADDAVLLEREVVIKALLGRRVGISEARDELARHGGDLELARSLALRALADIRPDVGLDDAGTLMLDRRRRGHVHAALELHTGLRAKLAQAEEEAVAAERRAAELRAAAGGEAAVPDTAALELAVAALRDEGPLADRLADAEAELASAEDGLALALGALAPAVELDLLRHQPVPQGASIDRFAAEEEALAERAATLADRRERLEGERRQLAADRARLSLGSEVPSDDELDFVRQRRDRDWGRIRQRLDGDATVEVYPENFARGIALADQLADTLRQHAGLAAQAAELDLRADRLADEFTALARADEALADDRRSYLEGWRAAWSASGVLPLSPREMTDWLRGRAVVVDRASARDRWVRAVLSLRARHDLHQRALAGALAAVDTAAGPEAATPAGLLLAAEARIDAAATQRAAAAELARDLAAATSTATRQRTAADAFARELESWQAGWHQLVADSGWPPDVGPGDAREILAGLEELGARLKEMDQLTAQVATLRDRVDAFDAEAGAVIAEVAPELGGWPVGDGVGELGRRLEEAIERRSRRRELERERDQAQDGRAALARRLTAARADLGELLSLAGVADVEALPGIEDRAFRRTQLSQRLPDLEARITESGQAPLAELLARAAAVDIDVLDAESQAAEAELARLEGELRVLDERRGQLGSERDAMERAGGAAEAGQVVEQRLAELRDLVERYLRVSIAAWALREAIDQYRREHKDPLLRRASELFPRLTCGSFAALEADFDETDEPVLIGVRASGEKVSVARMSTGTREQLYLALRLASLERHVELHGPMPVVLDDVVLHSDPRRKTAILQALAELGRHTQVVCFSHDPQVVALAQRALDAELITVHELGAREIPGALHPVVGAGDVRPIRRTAAA